MIPNEALINGSKGSEKPFKKNNNNNENFSN